MKHSSLSAALILSVFACSLHAQDERDPFTQSLWGNRRIEVVTVASRDARQPCLVDTFSASEVTCKVKHGKPPIRFARTDIAALIEPETHSDRNDTIVAILLGAASLAASFFVPLGWAITLRVLGGISIGALAYGDGPIDHRGDRLLYTKPVTEQDSGNR